MWVRDNSRNFVRSDAPRILDGVRNRQPSARRDHEVLGISRVPGSPSSPGLSLSSPWIFSRECFSSFFLFFFILSFFLSGSSEFVGIPPSALEKLFRGFFGSSKSPETDGPPDLRGSRFRNRTPRSSRGIPRTRGSSPPSRISYLTVPKESA